MEVIIMQFSETYTV